MYHVGEAIRVRMSLTNSPSQSSRETTAGCFG